MRPNIALCLLMAVPVVTATLAAEPVLAKIEKYERKHVAILTGPTNAFTDLYVQSFTDLGRFDYEPIGFTTAEPEVFIQEAKAHMQQVAASRAAGRQVADKKFNDKVVSGKDLDRIANAAYVLVPSWTFGAPELSAIERVENKQDEHFDALAMGVTFQVELNTKVVEVAGAKVIGDLKSSQRVATAFSAHYPKGGSDAEARAYLTQVAQTLQQKGVLGLQGLMGKEDIMRLVKNQSPDQVYKATAEAQKKAQNDLERMRILAAGLDHPAASVVTQLASLKSLDGNQLRSLHSAQVTADRLGQGSPLGKVVSAVNSPMFGGALADTMKQARSLDAFLLKAPISSLDGGHVSFAYGNETGVDLDTWFRISYTEMNAEGVAEQITKGWAKVRSTGDRTSSAQTIIGGGFEEGDQLTELPKTGVNSGVQLGAIYNLTGKTDAARLAFGGNFKLDYDLAPTLHRSTGRQVAMPEVYGGLDLGMHVFGNGLFLPSAHVGVTGKSYWGQLVGTYGLRLGGYGFPKGTGAKPSDLYTATGISPELGLNFVMSPDLSLEAGVNTGFYYEGETGSFLVPVVPRVGASYSF